MDILNNLYETNFDKINFIDRKYKIENNFTIIHGPKKSGKSFLIYDYLQKFEEKQYLYVDLNDIRIDKETIFYNLDRFLLKNKTIELLAIDNIDYIPNFQFANIKSIILSSTLNLSDLKYSTLNIAPLDFEEFILFDNKHQNTTNSFNSFLKFGNFPEIIQFNEIYKLPRNQEILKLNTSNQTQFEILKLLIKSSGELKSIFQLFNNLKMYHKVSKDIFYNTCKIYEENHSIFFVQKFEQPKAMKKIFCYNHALIDAVNLDKKFNNLFSNMIFLELKNIYDDIFYIDNIDFYIQDNNSIVLAIPFFNSFISVSTKILPQIEKYNITDITIVTIATSDTIYIDEIECEIVPFYEWALSL